jgi:uncharacterized membrane protein SpoIIM required for sporulation
MLMRSSIEQGTNGQARPGPSQEAWDRLTTLVDRAASPRGLKAFSAAELRELQRLYRATTTDLSLARSQGRQQLAAYLNQLVGRAHGVVYARRPARRVKLGEFFGTTVPRTCKRNWAYWATALAIMVVGSVIGYLATAANPAWAEVLVSPGTREQIEPFVQGERPAGEYFQDTAGALGGGGLSGVLMVNNIRVALLSFGLGITWGLGTLYVLAQNSLMLGAVLGLGAYHGKLLLIASVIAPHGVVELSAIALAAGAGLRLGYALVNPGDLLRKDALVLAAREAGVMAMGTVPMLLYAGLMEGLISPQSTGPLANDVIRVLFGLAGGMLLYAWLLAGDLVVARWQRQRRPATASPQQRRAR